MATTQNLGLHLTDSDERFIDWLKKINGTGEASLSNMEIIDEAFGNLAKKSEPMSATLTAEGWVGTSKPFTQQISVTGLEANQNGLLSLAENATVDQRKAARDAIMSMGTQGEGYLTVIADGKKPTENIPLVLLLMDSSEEVTYENGDGRLF